LKALRKLEEMEIKGEHKELSAERKTLQSLLASDDKQWEAVGTEVQELKKLYGPKTALGKRRTELGEAPSAMIIPLEAMIEREPITVVCSSKGWIRALKGHVEPGTEIKFKEGDWAKFQLQAETTDKLVIFATNGKFYTIPCDKLPGGRGHGEPVRLYVDLGNEHDIVAMMIHKPGAKLLVAAHDGRGFVVPTDEIIAQTKNGRQVLSVPEGVEANVCVPADGDMLAVIGDNRKLLIFKLSEVPEMTRGRGVMLQKYKDGGLSDAKVYTKAEGLTWRLGDKIRTETHSNLKDWIGERAQAGRLPPTGFPKANKFG
jgi:topoisomerase-4 subunit A